MAILVCRYTNQWYYGDAALGRYTFLQQPDNICVCDRLSLTTYRVYTDTRGCRRSQHLHGPCNYAGIPSCFWQMLLDAYVCMYTYILLLKLSTPIWRLDRHELGRLLTVRVLIRVIGWLAEQNTYHGSQAHVARWYFRPFWTRVLLSQRPHVVYGIYIDPKVMIWSCIY